MIDGFMELHKIEKENLKNFEEKSKVKIISLEEKFQEIKKFNVSQK